MKPHQQEGNPLHGSEKIVGTFCFTTSIPNVEMADQAKAVIKCRFQKELDEYFEKHPHFNKSIDTNLSL